MPLISVPQTAEILGVTERTFRRYIKRGDVGLEPHKAANGRVYFDEEDVWNLASIWEPPKRGGRQAVKKETKPQTPEEVAKALREALENLEVTEGGDAGEKLVLYPWQIEVINDIPGHTYVAITMARANGKTTLVAGIAREAFVGCLSRRRGEVDIFAGAMKQAKIAFEHVLWFMKDEIEHELWRERPRYRVVNNSQEMLIEDYKTGSKLQARGSDPARAHGMAPSFLICDEPAQWQGGGRELWATLDTGLGKQLDPKVFSIGTKPEDADHWFNEQLNDPDDPDTAVHKYVCDEDDDDFSMDSIRKANPSYDFKPELRQAIKIHRRKAQKNDKSLRSFRAMRLNKGTSIDEDREAIVKVNNWNACVRGELPDRGGPLFIGFDLGGGTSMSACAFYWSEVGRLECYGAFPADPDLEERGHEDGVGDRYLKMEERGELILYPGMATNNHRFLLDMTALVDDEEVMVAIADRYKQLDVSQAMVQADAPWDVMFRPVGRGPEGGADVRAFQNEVLDGHLRSIDSLLLSSAISESKITRDPNGNPALDKRRSRGRNDALQATILAVGSGRRWRIPDEDDRDDVDDYLLTA